MLGAARGVKDITAEEGTTVAWAARLFPWCNAHASSSARTFSRRRAKRACSAGCPTCRRRSSRPARCFPPRRRGASLAAGAAPCSAAKTPLNRLEDLPRERLDELAASPGENRPRHARRSPPRPASTRSASGSRRNWQSTMRRFDRLKNHQRFQRIVIFRAACPGGTRFIYSGTIFLPALGSR